MPLLARIVDRLDWYYKCDHVWKDIYDVSGRGVICIKCNCPGEREIYDSSKIYWPAT